MIKDSPELEELREKFKIYYHNNLKEKFSEMEKHRKKYLIAFILLFFGIFFVFPALFIFFFANLINTENLQKLFTGDTVSLEGVLFAAIVITAILYLPVSIFKRKSKNNVMEPLIGFFGNFQYKYGCRLNDRLLERTKLITDFDGGKADDYFCGSYKDVEIIISEENLYKVIETQKSRYKKNVFKGIVIVLDMNKNFKGQTVVKKDKGWLGNKLHSTGLKKVALEDIEFEKLFEVFSDDQIEARYLLTTAFMERMIRLKNSYKSKKIEFSFFDNKLAIALHLKKNMFEVSSIFRSSTDYKHIEEVFNQMYAIFSIIDTLKLNQKAVL